eukprot:9692327-Alexandrium_andersonii.AAC.1
MDDFEVGGPAQARKDFFDALSKKVLLKVSDPVAPSASGELGLPGSFLGRTKRRDEHSLINYPN